MDNFSSIKLADLSASKNWQQQFKLISTWADLVSVKTELRMDSHLVKGCETQAWLAHALQGDHHHFYFDADSKIIRGLGALLVSQFENKTTQELKEIPLKELFVSLGLQKHLSPSRANGFRALCNRCCSLANIPPKL